MSSVAAEQFLLLAKSVRGSSAVDLVIRALEHPDIYGFEEFLRLDSLKKSLEQDHPLLLSTLELFAYGTLSDYESQSSHFISLSSLARHKLQLLTLASLAIHARILPYELLLKHLQIESIRELEDLIIHGIYAQVIRGKLDQLNNRLNIEYAIARDINSNAFNHIEDVLDKWCLNCDEQEKYDKEMLSMIKIVDLDQKSGGSSKRDLHENNNTLENLSDSNTDSTQSANKKFIRYTAKRNLRS